MVVAKKVAFQVELRVEVEQMIWVVVVQALDHLKLFRVVEAKKTIG